MAKTIAYFASAPATGNTPSGNPGAGTRETTSAPDTAPRSASTAPVPAGDGSLGAAPDGPVGDAVLSDADFKQDGTLRKDAVKRIEEGAPPRGGQRSFNEVTNETTVTTTLGGQTVTYVEDGDTRGDK